MLEGRGVGIGPGGRGVTFHSFSFCLPLIAKLLFLREMQGATLNQYFCGAFINYGLKSTNLSSSTCFKHLLPEPIASCLFPSLIRTWVKTAQKNKQIHHPRLPREMKTYKHVRIGLIYAIWCGKKNKDFCAKLLSVNRMLFKYVWFTWLSSSSNKDVFYSEGAAKY